MARIIRLVRNLLMTKLQKLAALPVAGALLLGGGAIAGYAGLASAQSIPTTAAKAGMPQRMPGVFGAITAINGSTITVSGMSKTGTTTYTVDASSATVTKAGATSTVSSLAVGDKIAVQGTVTGTSVVATEIMDGFGASMPGMRGPGGPMRGFGGVMGTVSAVNGNTLTVTGKNGTTYTVDASSAKVSKVVDLSVGDIKVGDTVGVQGSVSGSSVTAQHIMDGAPPTPQAPPARQ